ncbi:hypothetical protein [Roseovarius sp. D0-M9]|uniref:hypothetical protein n=1 Tax=Roseovarius sp. D0-M9 TaxID=3127117 RepID=UPI00300FBDB9
MADSKNARENQTALAKEADKGPSVSMQWDEQGKLEIHPIGNFRRLEGAVGNLHVSTALVTQIASLGSAGKKADQNAANFALGFVDAMQPMDAAEASLMAQMAATHQAAMMMVRRLNQAENVPQQESAERAFNKLTRSYAAQMDTLKRYRSKGQQTVRVERVTVEEGGQAIVGNVQHGGGENEK